MAGYRDKAILELMYSCGLRAGEIVNLEVRNIDFTHRLAKVRGKLTPRNIAKVAIRAAKL